MGTILETKNITKRFGGLTALDSVNLSVERNTITALIGPNGAGKTTMINVICGFFPPDQGSIVFNGNIVSGKKDYQIARNGIARTFQTPQIFSNMTVLENVMIGMYSRTKTGLLKASLMMPGALKEERTSKSRAMSFLEMVAMEDEADTVAASLPIGKQRLLEIARAMASKPHIMLLDEPAAGLNTQETRSLGELIFSIKKKNISILIVEHDMELVMDISDKIYVLNFGKYIASGNPSEIQQNNEVIRVYLGDEKEIQSH